MSRGADTTSRLDVAAATPVAADAEPRWAVDPRVVLRALDGNGLVVLRGDESTLLRGEAFAAVVERIDGTRTADQIVAGIGDRVPAAHAYYAIQQMQRRGLIVPTAEPGALAERAMWSAVGGADATDVDIGRKTVAVSATADVPGDVLAATLDGLQEDAATARVSRRVPTFDEDAPDLLLVLASDYTDPVLEQINRSCLAAGVDWLLVRPDGSAPWIGPLMQPGTTACWECLMNRRRMHRRIHAVLGEPDGHSVQVPIVSTSLSAALIGRMAALEASKVLRGIRPPAVEDAPDGSAIITEFSVSDWTTQQHVVVRRPQCPACGDPTPPQGARVEPVGERVHGHDDGGRRTVRAEETYRRYRHHVSRISGAVVELAEQSTPYDGVHVWYSGSNLGLAPKDLLTIERTLRAVTAGKGTTAEQARTGALAEALERYSSTRHGEERTVRGSLRELRAHALHPNDAMLFSDEQLDDTASQGRTRASWFNSVPARFDEDAVIDWTPVWSLTDEREVLLPTAYCYYGTPGDREMGIVADSNGCAAGNTVTEAILQAFFELVERDAVAVWWYNRLRRPAVDLASFGDPWIDDMIEEYRSKGRAVWAIDLTTDLEIPTFAAISRRTDTPFEAPLLGFGAHLDPRIAVLRALGEINQMSPVDEDLDDANPRGVDHELMTWLRTATIESQPYLVPDPGAPVWRWADHPSSTGADLAEDVRTCRERVEQSGMSMYVLDQTRPDIGLPVVRVVVPGLRPFWSRYAPGRLYDLPVQLGWLEKPNTRADLNPIPFFL
ncbi:MAG TPA: TOMM precursor leader peptide-binding protein [Microbacterium sp.]|jgi:ribosomal protein S12 methylthiotransferase accessory factor|nr:TOMM precursor leader peptide-binding protein [Microbacterium sp.]